MNSSPSLHIMGHGLAGAILAEYAHQRGWTLTVSHDGGPSSSRVAAGMFTPVTGNKLNLTWLAESILPVMQAFYPALEKELAASFFHERPTLRVLQNALDPNVESIWFDRVACSGLPFHSEFGAIQLRHTGWVDLNVMLDALTLRRKALGQWGEPTGAVSHTVWAEGYRAAEHPLWWEAGWRNAHGDVLTLRIPDLAEDRMYNFGKFLVPIGNQLFRCGATYNWETQAPVPRDQGRLELETALSAALKLPFEVVDHQAGVRPVALARVPILGPHPEQADQLIFNGFGSKGVLYAPFMANRLLDWIDSGADVEQEAWAPRRILRQRERRKHGHSEV